MGHPSLGLLLPQFPGEVVEDAELIAVEIGDPELAQVPGLVFGFGEDLCSGIAPAMVQFVDFLPALQIQPDDDPVAVAVVLAERCIRQDMRHSPCEMPPIPPWSSPQSKWNPSALT